MIYDTIIIGSGAAGLSAGIYAARYKMKTLIMGGEFGGETAKAGVIWNYPGYVGEGYELVKTMKKQAVDSGAEFMSGKAEKIETTDGRFQIKIKDKTFEAKTIIFTVGTDRAKLNLPNEVEFTNKGVHYCFTCDAPLYGGKIIAVVGGGDAAFKGAEMAAEYCEKIYIIVRKDQARAEPANIERVKARGEKVEILYNTQVAELVGKDHLEKIILNRPVNGSTELVVDGLFVEIGAKPNAELVIPLGAALDPKGYVVVDEMMRTNVPGVFSAGDSCNMFGAFKQSITAAAGGAVAATSAYHHTQKNK